MKTLECENKQNALGLSNFVWDQKSKNIDVSLELSIYSRYIKLNSIHQIQGIVYFA